MSKQTTPRRVAGTVGGGVAVLSIALLAGCSSPRVTTEWSGLWPSGLMDDKNCIDPGFYGKSGPPPVTMFDRSKELGFRSDGTVVWRERK